MQAKSEKLWTAVARREVVEAVLADWLELCQENQAEWSTLTGSDPSRYCPLIGGTLLSMLVLVLRYMP